MHRQALILSRYVRKTGPVYLEKLQKRDFGQTRGFGQTQGFAPTQNHTPDRIVGADPRVRPNTNIATTNHTCIAADPRVRPNTPRGLSLPVIVQRFKSMTTKRYIDGVKQPGWQPFYNKLWQRNYYEHIIRDDNEFNEVKRYILTNPENWPFDRDNPDYDKNM